MTVSFLGNLQTQQVI